MSLAGQPSLISLLSSFRIPRQAEAAILQQLAGSTLTSVMSGRLLPGVTGTVMSYLLLPLLVLLKSMAKTMAFCSIVVWLFTSMMPLISAATGLTGAGAFVGRALRTDAFPYPDLDVGAVYQNMTTRGLELLKLESPECRKMLACRAGEFVLTNYPIVAAVLRNTGVGDAMFSYSKKAEDLYTAQTWSVLMGQRNGTCDDELDSCPSFLRFEAMFDPKKREQLNNRTNATPAPSTTTTETEDQIGNDVVVNAIKSMARNSNNSFLLNLIQ